jgi:hypothetical protein
MKLDKNCKSAFTLMEAAVTLLVMAMIVNLATLTIKNTQQKAKADFEVKIERIIQDLESKKHDFRLVKVNPDSLILYSKVEKKRYHLSVYAGHSMLRYTPGHMPLMLGVQKVFFHQYGNLIQIKIVANGKKSTSYVFIPPDQKS